MDSRISGKIPCRLAAVEDIRCQVGCRAVRNQLVVVVVDTPCAVVVARRDGRCRTVLERHGERSVCHFASVGVEVRASQDDVAHRDSAKTGHYRVGDIRLGIHRIDFNGDLVARFKRVAARQRNRANARRAEVIIDGELERALKIEIGRNRQSAKTLLRNRAVADKANRVCERIGDGDILAVRVEHCATCCNLELAVVDIRDEVAAIVQRLERTAIEDHFAASTARTDKAEHRQSTSVQDDRALASAAVA